MAPRNADRNNDKDEMSDADRDSDAKQNDAKEDDEEEDNVIEKKDVDVDGAEGNKTVVGEVENKEEEAWRVEVEAEIWKKEVEEEAAEAWRKEVEAEAEAENLRQGAEYEEVQKEIVAQRLIITGQSDFELLPKRSIVFSN
jgi:hypothetical protein